MRVTKTKNELNRRLSNEIRRQYPLVYTQAITESFDALTSHENASWALSTKAHIEALPQYAALPGGLEGLKAKLGEEKASFVDFMVEQGGKGGFFDPYVHQAEALEAWSEGADLVVSTGTGSGKTECFLWPIAGHLFQAARRRNLPRNNDGEVDDGAEPIYAGAERGVKAFVLYPMNALVTDQLKRLRGNFGKESVADALKGDMSRRFQFGQYTGRTQFHGSYAKRGGGGGSKNSKLNRSKKRLENLIKIHGEGAEPDDLYLKMMKLGMIPSKGRDVEIPDSDGKVWHDLSDFYAYEHDGNYPLLTRDGDRELLFRHEMHNTGYSNLKNGDVNRIQPGDHAGGTPDIMVTNYSMLEYMLKRPLEHGIFEDTRHWLTGEGNHLLFVLDEAHLYQGALGTEVGYLVRRLLASLGIANQPEKVQFILTSASLGADEASKEQFVSALTGRGAHEEDWTFGALQENKEAVENGSCNSLNESTVFVQGTRWEPDAGLEWAGGEKSASTFTLPNDLNEYVRPIIEAYLPPEQGEDEGDGQQLRSAWEQAHALNLGEGEVDADQLRATPLFVALYGLLHHEPVPLETIASRLFEAEDREERRVEMTEQLLNFLATVHAPRPGSSRELPILGVRAHLIYRGLPTLYWNITEDAITTRSPGRGHVGYPIRGCRRCGAPYLNMWMDSDKYDDYEYVIGQKNPTVYVYSSPIEESTRLEVYLAEEGEGGVFQVSLKGDMIVTMDGPPHLWVSSDSYAVKAGPEKPDSGDWRPGYLPSTSFREAANQDPEIIDAEPDPGQEDSRIDRVSFSKSTCIQCKTNHQRRRSDQITDYMTRGDSAFSKLINELLKQQDGDDENPNPNKGKKTMAFSDSRSRAARLARTIQDDINLDEQRNLVMHLVKRDWYKTLPSRFRSLDYLYFWFVLHLTAHQLEPFANVGSESNPRRMFAKHRIQTLSALLVGVWNRREDVLDVDLVEEIRRVFATQITSMQETIPEKSKALRNYELFLPTSGPPIDAHLRQDLGGVSSRSAAFRAIRKLLFAVLTNGLRYTGEEQPALTRTDKKLVVGSVLSPRFWNGLDGDGNISINVEPLIHFIQRDEPDGLAIDVDAEEFRMRLNTLFNPNNIRLATDELRANEIVNRDLSRVSAASLSRVLGEVEFRLKERQKASGDEMVEVERVLYAYQSSSLGLQALAEQSRLLIRILSALNKRYMNQIINVVVETTGIQTPKLFAGGVMDFMGSKDFSIGSLGLGRATATNYERKLTIFLEDQQGLEREEAQDEVERLQEQGLVGKLDDFVHWMVRPSLNETDIVHGKQPYSGGKAVSDSDGANFNATRAKLYGGAKFGAGEWGIDITGIRNKINELLDGFSNDDRTDIRRFIEQEMLKLNAENEASALHLLKSEFVQLVNLDQSQIGACPRCVTCYPLEEENTREACHACGFTETRVLDDCDDVDVIKQRILDPWRNPLDLINNSDEIDVMIVRAEEHTAQINTTKDDDEMYTAAEEFELLFQDIPFVIPEDDEHWTPPQSPIDVLSCTTTMEVGIDIGSLTTVALRTVPREPANYQQRVGRAGRGASEVCIALSWCDNLPHAQNMFNRPLTTLAHPSNSPVIYMDNRTIQRRHIIAALFQGFFKRMQYDRQERNFPMFNDAQMEKNLMESMGTTREFFLGDENALFSLARMEKWIAGTEDDAEVALGYEALLEQLESIFGGDGRVGEEIRALLVDLDDIKKECEAVSE